MRTDKLINNTNMSTSNQTLKHIDMSRIIQKQTLWETHLSISATMTGRLAAMFVLVPNFLPNGRSQIRAWTLPLGRGRAAGAQRSRGAQRSTEEHRGAQRSRGAEEHRGAQRSRGAEEQRSTEEHRSHLTQDSRVHLPLTDSIHNTETPPSAQQRVESEASSPECHNSISLTH